MNASKAILQKVVNRMIAEGGTIITEISATGAGSLPAPVESLSYVRVSKSEWQPGFEYMNVWPTGNQELIFTSHERAQTWAAQRNARYSGPIKAEVPEPLFDINSIPADKWNKSNQAKGA